MRQTVQLAPPDRRSSERHIRILQVGLVRHAGGEDLCLIRNVSAGGLMARIYRHMAEGEEIEAELRCGRRLFGKVVWTKAWDFGVSFANAIDVARLLSAEPQVGTGTRPRLPRIKVDSHLALRQGARLRRGRLRDISPGGAKIALPAEVEVGAGVMSLPGLPPIAGTIRWAAGEQAGFSFNQPLQFDVLARWIHLQRVGAAALPAGECPIGGAMEMAAHG